MLNFAHPAWLFGLLLLPLLGLIQWQRVQRERRAIAAFAREPLLEKMDVAVRPEIRLWRGFLILGAIACGLVALAQPRWGLTGDEALMAREGSAVIAFDVSKSMLAADMRGESRLAAGQRLVNELLPGLAGWKVGLVAFAGEAVPLVPLTTDHSAVETLLERARPGSAPGVGSNIEEGLKAALALFTTPGKRLVVLVSDGEALKGNAESITGKLRGEHVQILSVGVGTRTGAIVPGQPDLWGNPTAMTYRGEKVVSRLDEDALKRLASDTGGMYVSAGDPLAVTKLGSRLAGRVTDRPEEVEQGFELFQVPLALMLMLMLVEAGWSLAGRARHEVRFADHVRQAMGERRRGLLGRLKRPALGVMLLAIATTQSGFTWKPSWLPNQQAAEAYKSGDYPKAQSLLDSAVKADPENSRLQYNLGNVYYQQGNFQAAANVFQRAQATANPSERPAIDYNLGNSYFRLAEATDDPKGYQRAIEQYEHVLAAKPDDADAKHNLEVAKRRLEQAKKKQGQKSQGGQGGSGNQNGNPNPVGVRTQRQPLPEIKHLPSEAEVDALLKALENDERQRQAEGAEAQNQDPMSPGFAQNLLQQALGQLDLQKDW